MKESYIIFERKRWSTEDLNNWFSLQANLTQQQLTGTNLCQTVSNGIECTLMQQNKTMRNPNIYMFFGSTGLNGWSTPAIIALYDESMLFSTVETPVSPIPLILALNVCPRGARSLSWPRSLFRPSVAPCLITRSPPTTLGQKVRNGSTCGVRHCSSAQYALCLLSLLMEWFGHSCGDHELLILTCRIIPTRSTLCLWSEDVGFLQC